ncbi:MAG TPA: PExPT-CTERM protein [Acidobacteriaceae bacterium]
MKRSTVMLVGCAAFLLAVRAVHAQDGCDNSPENPTVVLALVGGAGALFSALRARLRRGRD